MDTADFVTRVRRLRLQQRLHITFKKDAIDGVRELWHILKHSPTVKADASQGLASAWAQGQALGTFTIAGLNSIFVTDAELAAVAPHVECIDVDHHPAKILDSRRLDTRRKAFDLFISEIVTFSFLEKIAREWGLRVLSETCMSDGIGCLLIKLAHGNTVVAEACIDGWTGQVVVDGNSYAMMPEYCAQVQELLITAAEKTIDKMTAV